MAIFEPVTDPTQLFLSLTLDQHAINMVPDGTLQLTATPRNAVGAPMIGLPTPVFRSSDTTAVQVDSMTGLVKARRATSGVIITVELVAPGNVRRVDTAKVNVTDTPPASPLATLTLDPVPPDSAVWPLRGPLVIAGSETATIFEVFGLQAFGSEVFLNARALDATATEIPGLVIEYASLDSSVATVDRWTGQVNRIRPGQVRMVAQTTAYGVSQVTTTTFTVTLPSTMDVWIYRAPNGAVVTAPRYEDATGPHLTVSEYRVAPHGYVTWLNLTDDTVDVTFDDPTNVAGVPASLCDILETDYPWPLIYGPGPHCGPGNILVPPISANHCYSTLTQFCARLTVRVRQFPVPGVYRFSSTRTGMTGRIVVSDEGATGAATP